MTFRSTAARQGKWLPSPLTTLLVLWGLEFTIYFSQIIQFERVPDSWGFLYIVACLALFSLGFASRAHGPSGRSVPMLDEETARARWLSDARGLYPVISACAVAGIVASLLFGAEMIFFVGVNPFNFQGNRALFVEREVTGLSRLASVIGAGGFFSLVAGVLCWEDLPRKTRTLWLLSPLLLSLFSILSAGRQTVLQLVVLLVFAVLSRRSLFGRGSRKTTRKWLVATGVALALALSYGLMAGRERNEAGDDVNRKDRLLSIFDAHLNPGVDAFLETLPQGARDSATESLVYFGHELPSFLVFWETTPPGPYLGLWELPFLARRFENARLVSTTVEQRMASVYARFGETGHFAQVWQTWIRDLIIDFGKSGTLLVVLLLGLGTGRVHRAFQRSGSLSGSFIYLGIQLCCVYSIMLAPVSDTLVFFYMAGGVFFYRRGQRREKSSRRVSARSLVAGTQKIASAT